MIYDQVMVDLETTGISPDHCAIIQLSAVRFNMDQEVDSVFFDKCLSVPKTRYWEADTQQWWSEQDPAILEKIWKNMRDPATVLREFRAWVVRDLEGTAPVFWSKPTLFDFPMLDSHFKEHGIAQPFHYSEAQDLRSWCRSRGIPNLDRELDFDGTAHDAIQDVLHQLNVLFTLLERTNVEVAA